MEEDMAPAKPKWVPPSVRRRMEEEASKARNKEEPISATQAEGQTPTEGYPVEASTVPVEASSVPAQKWVPPSVRRRQEEEAAKLKAAAEPSEPEELGAVEGLGAWLKELNIAHTLPAAEKWCDEQGASFVEEIIEHMSEFVKALDLTASEQQQAINRASSALLVACPKVVRPGDSAGSGKPQQTLRTLSTTGKSSSGGSAGSGGGLPQGHTTARKCDLGRVLTLQVNLAKAANRFKSALTPKSGGVSACKGDLLGAPPPIERCTSVIRCEGPLAGLVASVPLGSGNSQLAPTLSVMQVPRAHAHLAAGETPGRAAAANIANGGEQPKLTRGHTSGFRENLVKQAKNPDAKKVTLDHGQTGAVFTIESGGKTIAVFKPNLGEGFERRGLEAGSGYKREEAAYLVDRLCGSQAGVPVTSRASLATEGEEEVEGSVQAFVDDVVGFSEDFGVPRDLEKARGFLCSDVADAVALLDMRVFNMDRHGGNLLVTRRETPHSLGPIDHGCCLPPWWCLSQAIFDAWSSWSLFMCEPSQEARDIAWTAYDRLPKTCAQLVDLLDKASIITLEICTLFVFVGIYDMRMPIATLASKMVRDEECFEELSWLEERVFAAALANGAKCRVEEIRDSKEVVVDDEGEGLDETAFLKNLEEAFRYHLAQEFPQNLQTSTSTSSQPGKASRW